MIGLLIISHSAAIASGVKELAEQMVNGQVRIAATGGTHDGQLGTSADLITAVLAELRDVDAVLALVDMGSAVMSAEMALEMSGKPFLISGAPLVEGALVGAVEAMRADATLDQVSAAASRALDAKGLSSIATPDALPPPAGLARDADEMPLPSDPAPSGPTAEVTLAVTNKVGLHMRPAKEFVQVASRFACTIRVNNLDRPGRAFGNAKSMLDVMKLGVSSGHRIHIRAEGDDSLAALDALSKLIADNFGEE